METFKNIKSTVVGSVLAVALVASAGWRARTDDAVISQEFVATVGEHGKRIRLRAAGETITLELLESDDGASARGSVTLDDEGVSSISLRDAKGAARFVAATDPNGATVLAIKNGHGAVVWGVQADRFGNVAVTSPARTLPTALKEPSLIQGKPSTLRTEGSSETP